MNSINTILAFETSCDDTSIAIVQKDKSILVNNVVNQVEKHQSFGGVVPEIASREHLRVVYPLLHSSLQQANLSLHHIDAFAATIGPGLMGCLSVGVSCAKSLALATHKPFIPVNHLAAHALTIRLSHHNVVFPFLLLLVSGGHCLLALVHNPSSFQLLGSTRDDATGECFDKIAKLLSLPYPGGPSIEHAASLGNHLRFKLPLPINNKSRLDFSFSGLKTATSQIITQHLDNSPYPHKLDNTFVNDLAASFQHTVSLVLTRKCHAALLYLQKLNYNPSSLVVAGGVAANRYIQNSLSSLSSQFNIPFLVPPLNLCTDNAAMVAWCALEQLCSQQHNHPHFTHNLNVPLSPKATLHN